VNEQANLIENNTTDFDKLLLNITKATAIRADQESQCSWAYPSTSTYIDCLTNYRLIGEQSAQLEVMTAKYFAQKGRIDKAKELYRNIITTYVGDSYRSYVRQAEFGLNDLKEIEAKAEKEKLEKEKAELQRQLEQEKLAKEKAEQERIEKEKAEQAEQERLAKQKTKKSVKKK
jgi:thiaminase